MKVENPRFWIPRPGMLLEHRGQLRSGHWCRDLLNTASASVWNNVDQRCSGNGEAFPYYHKC